MDGFRFKIPMASPASRAGALHQSQKVERTANFAAMLEHGNHYITIGITLF